MDKIARLRQEIDRLRQVYYNKESEWESRSDDRHGYAIWYEGKVHMCDELLSFLDTLESEKPMNQDGLEEEMEEFFETMPVLEHENIFDVTFQKIARHFAEWGAEHLRDTTKMIDKSVEEAAEISFDEADALTKDYVNFLAKGLTENKPRPIGPHWFSEYAKKRFIVGAEWQKSQMLKEAVEGVLVDNIDDTQEICLYEKRFGDKVRIVVLKEEE